MKTFLYFIPLLALPALALDGTGDSRGDWEYVCDNTGTCRIAGYQAEPDANANDAEYPNAVSVLFTRAAGADAPLTAEVALLPFSESDPIPDAVHLQINGQALGEIALRESEMSDGRGELNAAQREALVAALRDEKAAIVFSADAVQWQLSPLGAAEMWLGAESFQKRIGKPSSYMSPGNNDGEVLQPEAKPVITAAAVSQEAPKVLTSGQEYDALRRLLAAADTQDAASEDDTCIFFNDDYLRQAGFDEDTTAIAIYPLNADNVLVSTLCDMGAYNASTFFARVSADGQTVHGVLRVGTAGDAPLDSYADGIIDGYSSLRGVGDCAAISRYVWNGENFARTLETSTGLCRGFPGGAWDLPTFVSEVQTGE